MNFLYFLESIRNPFFDFLFSTITYIGDEIIFLGVAVFLFWCVDKRPGFYVLSVGLIGTVINQFLKLWFKVPRPWVKDPNFKCVPAAYEAAQGYSFPSGHTQNVTGTFGSIARYSKRRAARITSIVIIVLVAFSRMYLGVHTPLDVGVSLIIGTALVFLVYPLFESEERYKKAMPVIIAVMAALALGFFLYVTLMDKTGLDERNLYSGTKNAYTMLGTVAGLALAYFLDRRYLNFKVDGVWYAQLIKLAVGFALLLGIKSGLSAPLTALFGNEFIARAVRYFLIVIFAAVLWPLTFKYFAKLRIPALDRFTEKLVASFKKSEK
ncbi:MAG: phosphatase PAP2 family protein [Clostridia bacterium]|nr:phosphatase PAP2 family protein [Clostridia bacterium]